MFMKNTHYISKWEEWEQLCGEHGVDPHKEVEFGVDLGGGNSENFEYIGDMPEEEE